MTDLERLKKRLTNRNKKHYEKIIQIVDAFNEITGRKVNYSTKGSLKLMLYWLNEGYDVPQFKGVFQYKYNKFKGTDNEQYIAIDTFCRETKFENNLEQARWEWRRQQAQKRKELEPTVPKFDTSIIDEIIQKKKV